MPASELPRPADVTAGILESGARNKDFTGKGLILTDCRIENPIPCP
jgi:hypothetical protein